MTDVPAFRFAMNANSVVRHQQPFCAALIDCVGSIASCRLRDLLEQGLRVELKMPCSCGDCSITFRSAELLMRTPSPVTCTLRWAEVITPSATECPRHRCHGHETALPRELLLLLEDILKLIVAHRERILRGLSRSPK